MEKFHQIIIVRSNWIKKSPHKRKQKPFCIICFKCPWKIRIRVDNKAWLHVLWMKKNDMSRKCPLWFLRKFRKPISFWVLQIDNQGIRKRRSEFSHCYASGNKRPSLVAIKTWYNANILYVLLLLVFSIYSALEKILNSAASSLGSLAKVVPLFCF